MNIGYENIDFRETDILRLHELLMSMAGYEFGSQYKTDDNVILEVENMFVFVQLPLMKPNKQWSS